MITRRARIIQLAAVLALVGCGASHDDDLGSFRDGDPAAATVGEEGAEAGIDDSPWSDCGPGYCIDGSFCDECACYAPDTSISQAACAQGLIDPGCGIGECVGGGYCDGPNCPDGLCWPPDAPISQLMCQPQDPGGDADDDWVIGYCADDAFCDDASCLPQDAPVSVSVCQSGMVDDCGPGYCIDDAFCDDCACYTPDAPISIAKCQGGAMAKTWPVTIKPCPYPESPVYVPNGPKKPIFVGCGTKEPPRD